MENFSNNCCKRFETLAEIEEAYSMSLLEETPLLPESSKGTIKIRQGKGAGLIGCGGIKNFIIALMFVVIVYLCFS